MTRKEFRDFVSEKSRIMLELLDRKGAEYSADDSSFYNLEEGYKLSSADSPEEYAWNLRCKHLQSIKDLVTRKIIPLQTGIDEKCGDDILYGFIIWAITTEYYGGSTETNKQI